MKSKFLKIISLFLILILLCPSFSSSAYAQKSPDERIFVEVTYGFDNFTRFYRSTPVFVTITNTGKAISGTIQISFQGLDAHTTSYTSNFSLISNNTDTFVVNTSNIPSYTNVHIEIFDSSNKRIYSATELSLNQNTCDIYTGILSTHPENMDYLKEIAFYSETYGSYYAMRLEDLNASPALEDAESLKMIDILFLGTYDVSDLSQKQLTAIKEWIYDGGLLITGPAVQYAKLWDALDLEPNYMEAQAHSIETDFSVNQTAFNYLESPLSTQPLTENPTEDDISNARYGRSSLAIDNKIIEADPVTLDFYETETSVSSDFKTDQRMQSVFYGYGSVISLNFNFDTDAFAQWNGSAPVMHQMISDYAGDSNERLFAEYDIFPSYYSAQSVLPNSISVNDFNLGKYVAIFVIYILIIGPVLYIVLKKFDLRHLLWILIPCISFVCLGFIYVISAETRKNEPFLNQAMTISYDTDKAREEVTMCAILPEKGQYQLEIPDIYRLRYYCTDDIMVSTYLPFLSFQEEVQSSQDYDINYTSTENATEITINNTAAFSEWYFNGTREYLTSQNIYITVISDQGKYTIDIVNHTENDLDYSGIYVGDQVIITGPIKSGETVHLEDVSVESYDPDATENREYQSLLKLVQLESLTESIDPLQSQALTMIYDDRYNTQGSRPVYFVGINNHYQSDALRDSQWTQYGSLLVTKTVDIQYCSENGSVFIPDINALECETSDSFDSTYFYNGTCEISYTLPEDMILTELLSDTQTDVNVYVFNYTTDTYDRLEQLKEDSDHTLSAYVYQQCIQIKMEYSSMTYDGRQLTPVISLKGVTQK